MRRDPCTSFDTDLTACKVQPLRCLRARHFGFDARVLQWNRDAATSLGLDSPHAEVFELMRVDEGMPLAHTGCCRQRRCRQAT